MSVKYFPFDSLSIDNPDRAEDSSVLAAYLAAFFSNGVFSTQMDKLAARAQETPDLTVTVGTGVGLIGGRIYIQDSERVVKFEPGGDLDRIDRLVLRLDLNQQYRNIDLYVLKGDEALNPLVPSYTRHNVVYELVLATVSVPAGATSITAAQITDNRYDAELCGMVYALLGDVDTSVISAQLQSYYENFVADTEAWQQQQRTDMESFVLEIKDILSSADVGKLQLEIDAKMDSITTEQLNGQLALKTELGFELALQGFTARDTRFNADGTITQEDLQGHKVVTGFNADGSVYADFYVGDAKKFTKKTTFNNDGSISERLYAAQ